MGSWCWELGDLGDPQGRRRACGAARDEREAALGRGGAEDVTRGGLMAQESKGVFVPIRSPTERE